MTNGRCSQHDFHFFQLIIIQGGLTLFHYTFFLFCAVKLLKDFLHTLYTKTFGVYYFQQQRQIVQLAPYCSSTIYCQNCTRNTSVLPFGKALTSNNLVKFVQEPILIIRSHGFQLFKNKYHPFPTKNNVHMNSMHSSPKN